MCKITLVLFLAKDRDRCVRVRERHRVCERGTAREREKEGGRGREGGGGGGGGGKRGGGGGGGHPPSLWLVS